MFWIGLRQESRPATIRSAACFGSVCAFRFGAVCVFIRLGFFGEAHLREPTRMSMIGELHLTLPAMLGHCDVCSCILKNLSAAEAERGLGGAYHAGRKAVGECEEWRPMWNFVDVKQRLQLSEKLCSLEQWLELDCEDIVVFNDLRIRVLSEFESLVSLLINDLLAKGIIAMRFSVASARAGKRPTLLGCHELEILFFNEWTEHLDEWKFRDTRLEYCPYTCMMFPPGPRRRSRVSVYIKSLLKVMGFFQTKESTFRCLRV